MKTTMTLSLGIRFPLVLVIELAVLLYDAELRVRKEPPVIDKGLGLDNWSFAHTHTTYSSLYWMCP